MKDSDAMQMNTSVLRSLFTGRKRRRASLFHHSPALEFLEGRHLLNGAGWTGWNPVESFGERGTVQIDLGGREFANDVIPDGEGGMFIVGYVDGPVGDDQDALVARVDSQGAVAFSRVVPCSTSRDDQFLEGALTPTGNLVVMGMCEGTSYTLTAFQPDGSMLPSFNSGSSLEWNVSGHNNVNPFGIALDANGRITVGFTSTTLSTWFSPFLQQFSDSGLLNSSFGSGGLAHFDDNVSREVGSTLALDDNGGFVVGGVSGSPSHATTWRFLEDGLIDTDYGVDGQWPLPYGADRDVVAVNSVDRYVIYVLQDLRANRSWIYTWTGQTFAIAQSPFYSFQEIHDAAVVNTFFPDGDAYPLLVVGRANNDPLMISQAGPLATLGVDVGDHGGDFDWYSGIATFGDYVVTVGNTISDSGTDIVVSLFTTSHGGSPASGLSGRMLDVSDPIPDHPFAERILEDPKLATTVYRDTSTTTPAADLAGVHGDFPVNNPYPDGSGGTGTSNFVVELVALVEIPPGNWSLAFGTDDGGKVELSDVEFADRFNTDGPQPIDQIRFNGNRGFDSTGGTITVDVPTSTQLWGTFHEAGGGDGWEIVIRDASEGINNVVDPTNGWVPLQDGQLGWGVQQMGNGSESIAGRDRIGSVDVPLQVDPDGLTYGAPTNLPGLTQEWFTIGNTETIETLGPFLNDTRPVVPEFVDLGTWWDGYSGQQVAGINYPEQVTPPLDTGNNDQYTVRLIGELLFIESGTYRIADGADDLLYLAVDVDESGVPGDDPSEVVINDNRWSSRLRDNFPGDGPSPIGEVTVTVDSGGEWRPIEIIFAEGAQGDGLVVYWDYDVNDQDGDGEKLGDAMGFPQADADPISSIDAPNLLIPETHLRSPDHRQLLGGNLVHRLDPHTVLHFDLDAELGTADFINALNWNPTTFTTILDIDGVVLDLNVIGHVNDGDTFQLFSADMVSGIPNSVDNTADGSFEYIGEGYVSFYANDYYATTTISVPNHEDWPLSSQDSCDGCCVCGEPVLQCCEYDFEVGKDANQFPESQTGDRSAHLHSGEYTLGETDLTIPGRGYPWSFTRTYRSGVTYNGPLGHNWDFADNRRLVEVNFSNFGTAFIGSPTIRVGDVIRMDGYGRFDVYRLMPDGSYESPAGVFLQLVKNPNGTFTERDPEGYVVEYATADLDGLARMNSRRDANENTTDYQYDAQGRLQTVTDTLGRPIQYHYNASNRISRIVDFIGREVAFTYDAKDDLVAVTSPTVTETPTGNDFPLGKTEAYSYSSGFPLEILNHNLLTVTRPNEVAAGGAPYLTLTYNQNASSPHVDRLLSQRIGGHNGNDVPADGTISYEYYDLGPVPVDDMITPTIRTRVVDANGNRTDYHFNQQGSLLGRRTYTNREIRQHDPTFYDTQYFPDREERQELVRLAEGNTVERVYDETNPSRFQQGNLLELVETVDTDRFGDQFQKRTSLTYEPIYNQIATSTDPRGNDPTFVSTIPVATIANAAPVPRRNNDAQRVIGDVNSDGVFDSFDLLVVLKAGEYEDSHSANSTYLTGDWNGDGDFDSSDLVFAFVHGTYATATPLAATAVTDRYTTRMTYDYQEGTDFAGLGVELGITALEVQNLLLAASIPMGLGDVNGDGRTDQISGNLIRTEYPTANLLPGSNQAAVEGDTAQEIVDLMVYNDFGQLILHQDPEGNVTEYDYYSERDPNNDGTIENPAGNAVTGGYLREIRIDTTSAIIRNSGTDPNPVNVRTEFEYDAVGNVTREIDGRGIATDFVVNELNQIVESRLAAAVDQIVADPAEPLGLTPHSYVQRAFYDANDNVVRQQIEDRGNTSVTGGDQPPAGTSFVDYVYKYNILDELIQSSAEVNDSEDLVTRYRYDGNGNLVLTILPEGNATRAEFDERDLIFRTTSGALTPGNQADAGVADVNNGTNLLVDTTKNWTVSEWVGYSVWIADGTGAEQVRSITSNSGNSLQVTPAWDTIPDATSTYEITLARLSPNDPVDYNKRGGLPCQCTTYHYDGNGNLIESVDADDTDLSAINNSELGGLGDRTRYVYDGFDRLTSTIDAVGNQTVFQYDPAGNLVRSSVFGQVAGSVLQPPTVTGVWVGSSAWSSDFINQIDPDGVGYRIPDGPAQLNALPWGGITQIIVEFSEDVVDVVASDVELHGVNVPDYASLIGSVDYDSTNYRATVSLTGPIGVDKLLLGINDTVTDVSGNRLDGEWNDGVSEAVSGDGIRGGMFTFRFNAMPGDADQSGSNSLNDLQILASNWQQMTNETNAVADFDGSGQLSLNDLQILATNWQETLPIGEPAPISSMPPIDERASRNIVSIHGEIRVENLVETNLLAATEFAYDELSRSVQTDRVLFVNTIPTERAPDVADGASDLGKGNLTPGDNQAIPGVTGVTVLGRVTTRREYDRNSRPTFVVDDDEDTSRAFFDGANRVIQTVDPEGNQIESVYDDNHNLIEIRETDVSQVAGVPDEIFLTTYFYDSLNRIQRSVDNVGQTMYYRYDSRDNLVAMADAQGPLTSAAITRRGFADGAQTVNAINDFGNVSRYYYDGINRLTRSETILTTTGSGDGVHIGATLEGIKDDVADLTSMLPVADTAQGGGDGIIRIGHTYDANSLTSALIDDQGNITLYLYDNLNRPITETKAIVTTSPLDRSLILGARAVVTPTAATINNPEAIDQVLLDNQIAAAKSRIDSVSLLFPPLSHDVAPSPPPPKPTTIVTGYSPDSNVLISEDENDSEIFTKYDAINRAMAVRIFRSAGNPATAAPDSHAGDLFFAPSPMADDADFSGDAFPPVIGTNRQNFEYDGLSRMVRATDNNDPSTPDDDSVVTYAYDSLGRVIEETQRIGTSPAKAISSSWRVENLRSGLIYPNARHVEFTYDSLDRFNTITDAGGALPITDYDYIGSRVLVRAYPQNGTRMTHLDDAGTVDVGYDGLRRKVQLRDVRADNSLIVGFTHTYDRMNNKLGEAKLHDAANSETYGYDSAYRLLTFQRPNTGARAPEHSQFGLDGVGNWQSVDGETREHSAINEITIRDLGGGPFALTYDDNGNLTDDGELTFEWDFRNRLKRVTRKSNNQLIASYTYDAVGRRIRKEVTNSGNLDGTTDFYYDGWQVLEEYDGTNSLTQQFVYGRYIDEPLVMDRNIDGGTSATDAGDQRLFYHQNSQYSVYALTNSTGSIDEGYLYDAYGRQTVFQPGLNGVVDFGGDDVVIIGIGSRIDNPFLYTGRRLDWETNMHYFRARYLSTTLGRFISRDPTGYADGPNLNASYFAINGFDPTGQRTSRYVQRRPARPGLEGLEHGLWTMLMMLEDAIQAYAKAIQECDDGETDKRVENFQAVMRAYRSLAWQYLSTVSLPKSKPPQQESTPQRKSRPCGMCDNGKTRNPLDNPRNPLDNPLSKVGRTLIVVKVTPFAVIGGLVADICGLPTLFIPGVDYWQGRGWYTYTVPRDMWRGYCGLPPQRKKAPRESLPAPSNSAHPVTPAPIPPDKSDPQPPIRPDPNEGMHVFY